MTIAPVSPFEGAPSRAGSCATPPPIAPPPSTVSPRSSPLLSVDADSSLQPATRGLLSPFQLETRRCPTSTGWRETLVRSSDFKEYWNEWTLKEDGTGTLVTFTTRTLPDVAVPESIILSQTRRVLAKLMRGLLGALGER